MKKLIILLALVGLVLTACSAAAPAAQPVIALPATQVPATATLPPSPTPTQLPPSLTPAPTASPTADVTLFPTVTLSQNMTCRMGPDAHYFRVIDFVSGQEVNVQARTEDSTWLMVLSETPNKNHTCWIPVSGVKAFGEVSNLIVASPPPLPIGPSRASASEGVCGNNRKGAIVIRWSPTVSGTGYYVIRNGKNIAGVYGDNYIDHDTPGSRTPYVYTYVIQAYDSVGLSKTMAAVSVTMCK